MTHTPHPKRNRWGFVLLLAIVIGGGALLKAHGDLNSPLESTALLLNLSSGGDNFGMAGRERPAPPANAAAPSAQTTTASAGQPATTGTLTLDELSAALSAAGVDMAAVQTTFTAEGRTLDSLLAVVNSGRVSVADLAARLIATTSGQSNSANTSASPASAATSPVPPEQTGLFNLHWEAFGSVLYDLWVILAATVLVIVLGKPTSWFVQRLQRA